MYISPDSRLGDKVAIGILMLYGNKLILKYSNQKLNRLKNVFGSYWDPIVKSLRASQKYIENMNLPSKSFIHEASHMVSSEYLFKLSAYSNGLIQYQEPKMAILTPTFGVDEFYNSLFPEEQVKNEKIIKS